MLKNELVNGYFDWLYGLVYNKKQYTFSYKKLFRYLNNVEFIYIIPTDGNRYEDGINLRYRFANDGGFSENIVSVLLDEKPCSIFEMMVALALRCEETIMLDPENGDRTYLWFYNMIKNLGLHKMYDSKFNSDAVDDILYKLLNRRYKRNGEGGLFITESHEYDFRAIEIWQQMCLYIDEKYN